MAFHAVPLDRAIVDEVIAENEIAVGSASIREVNRVINLIEERLGVQYIRMEFGIPGLPANRIALEREREILSDPLIANTYAPFDGVPELKAAASEFVKLFMDVDAPPRCCVPTVGSMHGGFISMGIAGHRFADRDTILFLDPGFPVNKLQCQVWGLQNHSVDVYDQRGQKLLDAVEAEFATGRVGGLLYNTPNNPTWICFKESELEGLGKLCSKYDVIAIEDLAYFGMDFRAVYDEPGKPPYQPTIAHHTDQYILLISSSKIFSYAGQRVGISVISPRLFQEKSDALKVKFGTRNLGHAFVHGGMYPTTAGVGVSVQYGLAALFRAASRGEIRFTEPVREYAERARLMKAAFLENGFDLVYDNDLGEPLADGFYFTVSYPGLSGAELLEELVYYGVSAIALATTGSTRKEGIRACVSLTTRERVPELRHRLAAFHASRSAR